MPVYLLHGRNLINQWVNPGGTATCPERISEVLSLIAITAGRSADA
ncbi:MAG: hypothetical protein JRJ85_24475 [Deltaproteobacteria bacterium]|nr:hypothetical protein [Deltaproteobacteria bacterium]